MPILIGLVLGAAAAIGARMAQLAHKVKEGRA